MMKRFYEAFARCALPRAAVFGAMVIFTLGFELVLTLAQVSGITLLLSCGYELTAYCSHRGERGETK